MRTFDSTPIKADDIVPYKKTEKDDLELHIFYPENFDPTKDKARPSIVLFYGGGWSGGSIYHFYNQAKYLATRGMVAICPNYRTKSSHGVSPEFCISDAKSAIRFIRKNAADYGVDPSELAAGGGSAGGHIAAAAALTDHFDDPEDDLNISSKPDLLVLFNPVIDNGPEGYGYERVKSNYEKISPMHNIKKGMPPCLFMLGDRDSLIPVATGEKFKALAEAVGTECELIIYPDAEHGFFNRRTKEEEQPFIETLKATDKFLVKHGYLKGAENVDNWVAEVLIN